MTVRQPSTDSPVRHPGTSRYNPLNNERGFQPCLSSVNPLITRAMSLRCIVDAMCCRARLGRDVGACWRRRSGRPCRRRQSRRCRCLQAPAMTILYPAGDGIKFDPDYYRDHHLKTIMSLYGSSIKRFELRTVPPLPAPATPPPAGTPPPPKFSRRGQHLDRGFPGLHREQPEARAGARRGCPAISPMPNRPSSSTMSTA